MFRTFNNDEIKEFIFLQKQNIILDDNINKIIQELNESIFNSLSSLESQTN